MKNNKGITLVALVITVIILIILAGISISLLLGENGLITKAKRGAENYQTAEIDEGEKLNSIVDFIDNLDNLEAKTPTIQSTSQWEIESDYGNDGLSVGDIIAPKLTGITGERFYVINVGTQTDPVITLITELNVKTNDENEDNNIQSIDANYLSFDGSTNIYADSYIRTQAEKYANKLIAKGLILEDVEIEEGGNAVSGVKGRLMWGTEDSGEVQTLFTANLSDVVYGTYPTFLNYWLGTPAYNEVCYAVDGAYPYRTHDYITNLNWGLRPVIKILQSRISD